MVTMLEKTYVFTQFYLIDLLFIKHFGIWFLGIFSHNFSTQYASSIEVLPRKYTYTKYTYTFATKNKL